MKYLLTLAACFVLFNSQCKAPKPTAAQANSFVQHPMLQQTWLHSFEEDTDGLMVYRPNTYNFPPARRGRTGFAIEPGGKFMHYKVAPTDGLEGVEGKWLLQDNKWLKITFPNGQEEPYTLEIVSTEPTLLKIKKK